MARLIIASLILIISIPLKAISYTPTLLTQKIITISVSKKGEITIGRDMLTMEQATEELQKRLWKSYLGTGKMFDAVNLEVAADTPTATIDAVKKVIQEAQKKALIDICLEKHKKLFEDLSINQQKKIQRQFPVLFQMNY